jgi:Mn2+/Fe2+ NRAMP family transporter
MNQKALLGEYANKWLANILGALVLLVTAGLGIRLILKATGLG